MYDFRDEDLGNIQVDSFPPRNIFQHFGTIPIMLWVNTIFDIWIKSISYLHDFGQKYQNDYHVIITCAQGKPRSLQSPNFSTSTTAWTSTTKSTTKTTTSTTDPSAILSSVESVSDFQSHIFAYLPFPWINPIPSCNSDSSAAKLFQHNIITLVGCLLKRM